MVIILYYLVNPRAGLTEILVGVLLCNMYHFDGYVEECLCMHDKTQVFPKDRRRVIMDFRDKPITGARPPDRFWGALICGLSGAFLIQ